MPEPFPVDVVPHHSRRVRMRLLREGCVYGSELPRLHRVHLRPRLPLKHLLSELLALGSYRLVEHLGRIYKTSKLSLLVLQAYLARSLGLLVCHRILGRPRGNAVRLDRDIPHPDSRVGLRSLEQGRNRSVLRDEVSQVKHHRFAVESGLELVDVVYHGLGVGLGVLGLVGLEVVEQQEVRSLVAVQSSSHALSRRVCFYSHTIVCHEVVYPFLGYLVAVPLGVVYLAEVRPDLGVGLECQHHVKEDSLGVRDRE